MHLANSRSPAISSAVYFGAPCRAGSLAMIDLQASCWASGEPSN